jgi:two-component system sensor histidine kinase KdpD
MNFGAKITNYIRRALQSQINQYLFSIVTIGLIVWFCIPLSTPQGYHVVSYILLIVLSILATFISIGPIFITSTLSALVWNFFFIPPNLTFHIDKAEDMLMFTMFFIIALLNGIFTTRIRRQKQLAKEREQNTNALFQITKELSKASGIDEVLQVAIEGIKNHFGINSLFVLQDGNNMLHAEGRLQHEKKITTAEYHVAEWVFTHAKMAGAFTENLPNVDYTFFLLPGRQINTGVVAVKLTKFFSTDQKKFWDTFITLIANALEREFLGELAQKARFLNESDRLYKTLFNSISHELRIPVATIMGASDTLVTTTHASNVQSALCSEIFTASIRLNRIIENLLNISRLESGRFSVRLDWCDINDLINKVIENLRNELKPFSLVVSIPENFPLIKIDFGLMEQVLYNLLCNSTQHAPASSTIELETLHYDNKFVLKIADKGPGFPEEALDKLFKKFYRVESNRSGGLGLGLSIVKGFVEAHKGTITATNRPGGGALLTLEIPSEHATIENIQIETE